jgi:aspartate aminotransferase
MALGGWRIGFVRLPERSSTLHALTGFASEVWSSLAAPMQHAAAFVLDEHDEIRAHVAASRNLHGATTRAAHRVLVDGGVECRPPAGAFYLYPDFEPLRPQLAALGAHTGVELAELLLDRFEIAVLAGEAFGDEPAALRFRMATSLLYGADDDQRRRSLQSDDPAGLPWIASALERLRDALAEIRAA